MSLNPLQQFMVKPILPIHIAGYDLSFTNASLFMVLATAVAGGGFIIATRKQTIIPSKTQAFCEIVYEFIADLLRTHVGNSGRVYFPYVFSVFLFILMGNTLGMLPYSFTFTSQIIVTFAMALLVWLGATIVGIYKNGWHFFSLFFPPGTPIFIAPLLIPVEIISYLSRPFSLAVRLFANMVAGHAMLKIFAGFVIILVEKIVIPWGIVIAGLPILTIFAIIGFEFFVAFLQAYVFTILTCIYLNDALELH